MTLNRLRTTTMTMNFVYNATAKEIKDEQNNKVSKKPTVDLFVRRYRMAFSIMCQCLFHCYTMNCVDFKYRCLMYAGRSMLKFCTSLL